MRLSRSINAIREALPDARFSGNVKALGIYYRTREGRLVVPTANDEGPPSLRDRPLVCGAARHVQAGR